VGDPAIQAYTYPFASHKTRDSHPHLGNCAVFASMVRDFGDDTLPVYSRGQYLPGSHAPPIQIAKWDTLTLVMEQLLSSCVAANGRPGWSARVGDIAVFFVPEDSAFRRRWWRQLGEVGGMNSTGSVRSS
jgi:hypothetical protein